MLRLSGCRDVGLPRPGPDAPEVPVHADGPRAGAGGASPPLEVAADAAEQRGQTLTLSKHYVYEHSLSFIIIIIIIPITRHRHCLRAGVNGRGVS